MGILTSTRSRQIPNPKRSKLCPYLRIIIGKAQGNKPEAPLPRTKISILVSLDNQNKPNWNPTCEEEQPRASLEDTPENQEAWIRTMTRESLDSINSSLPLPHSNLQLELAQGTTKIKSKNFWSQILWMAHQGSRRNQSCSHMEITTLDEPQEFITILLRESTRIGNRLTATQQLNCWLSHLEDQREASSLPLRMEGSITRHPSWEGIMNWAHILPRQASSEDHLMLRRALRAVPRWTSLAASYKKWARENDPRNPFVNSLLLQHSVIRLIWLLQVMRTQQPLTVTSWRQLLTQITISTSSKWHPSDPRIYRRPSLEDSIRNSSN